MKDCCCIFFIFLTLAGCSKDKKSIDTSRITPTDSFGSIIGASDETDWTKDNSWTSAEEALFKKPDLNLLVGSATAAITFYPAFPNPCKYSFTVHLSASEPTFIETVVVDANLNVLFRNVQTTTAGQYVFSVNVADPSFRANTNYRVYYAIYNESGLRYYQGHGDISIME